MRRVVALSAASLFLVALALALPSWALAGTSTTIVVSRFTIPSSVPAYGVDTDGRFVISFGSNGDLLCRDLQTNTQVAIPGASGDLVAEGAAIADGTVVWIPWGNVPQGIDGYDIFTGQTFTLDTASGLELPVIGDGVVAWTTGFGGYAPVEGYDIATNTQFTVSSDRVFPEVGGVAKGLIVWDRATTAGYPDIWGYLVKTQKSIVICKNKAAQADPVTDGHTVAWQDWRDGDYADVWAYDVASKHTFRMSGAARCATYSLDADSGVFVWGDLRGKATSVRGYYVPSHSEFVVRPNSGATLISNPRVAKNLVVWGEQLGTVTTLRGARLHEWVCALSAPARTSSTTVTVITSSKGSAAKVTRMRFSVNGGRWSSWVGFRRTHRVRLTGAAGAKQVRVELRDAAGHLSRPATGTVRLV